MGIPFFLALLQLFAITNGEAISMKKVADIGIGVAQSINFIDTVPDENVPHLQNEKSMVEPWLIEIRSRIEGMDQMNRNQHRHFADFSKDAVTDYIDRNLPITAKMQEVHKIINMIYLRYQRMRDYKKRTLLKTTTLTSFAEETLSMIGLMDELHITLLGKEDGAYVTTNNLLGQLDTELKVSPNHMCRTQQSAQEFLYLLYEDIGLTELKALDLMEFSWTLIREVGDFREEKRLMREGFERRMNRTQGMFIEVISRADRTIWRCDPTYHTRGVTYEEVTRLLQGYIENEVDLSPDGYCRYDCAHYDYASNQGCYDNEFCSKQPACSGRVLKCQFVESKMEVCQASRDSTRRYEFVKYRSGHRLGQGGSCARNLQKANSWRRWLFWHCSYCMCLCDEQGPKSDRYFNLRPVTADVEHNRVVTGLRFVKRNRIFHLQIQEGELLPRGVINQTTLQWKPVDEYSITDRNVRQGVDYHMLTHDRRAIDLGGELDPEDEYLVTGLRFQNVGGHLHLEIQYTLFDFQSGKLIDPTEKTYWESGPSDQGREKLPLEDTHMSTRTTASSTPISNSKQYIEFTHTGFEQDAAQTTVPFIDIQDVVSNPPVPLSGIGIYYKGREGYGGFLGPKLVSYNSAPYLRGERKR